MPALLVAGMTAGVFAADMLTSRGVAVWLLYIVPLVLASRWFRTLYTQGFAAFLIVLVFLSYGLSPQGGADGQFSLVSRSMAAAVFLLTASLLTLRREAEERLELLNQELEQRVTVRTGELAAANSELREMILEGRRVGEEMRRRDAQLVEAQRIARLGSWEWDPAGNTLTWSEELYKIYGFSPGDRSITYDLYLSRIHPDDRESVVRMIGDGLREQKAVSFDHRIVLPDGAVRTLHGEGSVVADAAGSPVRLSGTGQDITERKRIEDALARSRDYYIRLLEDFPNLIWRARPDGTCDYFNKAWLDFTGRTLVQEVGDGWVEGVHPEDREKCREEFRMALASRSPFIMHYRLRHRDGTYHWLVDHGMPILGLDGEFTGYIGSCFDNEEQRRARDLVEAQARSLQRTNADLEQFASVASHDLQEPLRMVAGFLRLVDHRYSARLDDEGKQYIAYAVDGATRLQRLIADLLEYARLGRTARPFRAVDCKVVLDRALEHLAPAIREHGAAIQAGPLPVVQGDEGLLVQVFQNLIGNAIKFRGSAPPVIQVCAEQEGRDWQLSVEDNGIGIDPAQQHRIFDLFQRLHPREEYPGTGLGLAIAKRIVEAHGGRIGVDTSTTPGSRFWFTLPAMHSTTEEREMPS